MLDHGLTVERWAFWSPGATRPEQWRANLERTISDAEASVPCDLIPSMHRRRMSRLSKMAVQTALAVTEEIDADYLVFCSQHGEIRRTVTLLESIASGIELSPADFSQSVHNTSSGLYSIIKRARTPACSIASGAATFAYAWLEAEGFLAEHEGSRVLLVGSDDSLPREYAGWARTEGYPYSVALLLSDRDRHGLGLRVSGGGEEAVLPMGPLFLEWWLSGARTFEIAAEGRRFTWERLLGS